MQALAFVSVLSFFCLRVSSQRLARLFAGFKGCLRTASYHRCLRSSLAASTATRTSLCCFMFRNGFHDGGRHLAARPPCWGRFSIAALFQCSVLCFGQCAPFATPTVQLFLTVRVAFRQRSPLAALLRSQCSFLHSTAGHETVLLCF